MHGIGTTINIFHNFCDHICSKIEQFGVPIMNDHRIFILENLDVHHSPLCPPDGDGPC